MYVCVCIYVYVYMNVMYVRCNTFLSVTVVYIVYEIYGIYEKASEKDMDGSAVCVYMEGSRPILCELQSLVTYSRFPSPRRTSG